MATQDEIERDIRDRLTDAIAKHRRIHGQGALPVEVLRDAPLVKVIVEALDADRAERAAVARAERKRVDRVVADLLGKWNDLAAEVSQLDASASAAAWAQIAADASRRARLDVADDGAWAAAMRVDLASWWVRAKERPDVALPLIVDQLRRALAAVGKETP